MQVKLTAEEVVKQYVLIVLGCALYAAGFQFFMYPNDIVPGGLAGIAMIINYLTGLPVGTMVILFNIPLFIAAWKRFGTRFMVASLVGMFLSSSLMDIFALLNLTATRNLLLACIYGGAVKGLGLGIVYYAGGTTGGVDIVAKFIRKKLPYMNLGTIMLGMDFLVILSFAVIFNKYEAAMYAIVANFVFSKAVDTVLYGFGTSKVCYIISDNSREMAEAITQQLRRGVTMLRGEGAYTGTDKKVILCVIKKAQIVGVRQLIRTIDPNAFCIVTEAKEVFGNGFGDIYGD